MTRVPITAKLHSDEAMSYGIEGVEELSVSVLEVLARDAPLIDAFSSRYKAELVRIGVNREDEYPPQSLMYFFDDNLGGYTRKGLEDSLKED